MMLSLSPIAPPRRLVSRSWYRAGPGLVLLWLGLAAACGPGVVSPDEVEGPVAWSETTSATHLRHLWFSGPPDAAALEAARTSGVAVVVDLREAWEIEGDPRAAAEALGLVYYAVPVAKQGPFERESLERIEEIVRRHEGEQTLLHCSTGNRAAGWLATHLAGEHGMSVEDSLAVARRAGITKPDVEERVRAYLGG
jgi:protein tyrosine phosphatase (PTP) superfamily phosphohydrolase (DUF442 family)